MSIFKNSIITLAMAVPFAIGIASFSSGASAGGKTVKVGDYPTVGCNKKCRDYDIPKRKKKKARSSNRSVRTCANGTVVADSQRCPVKFKRGGSLVNSS